jgi:hypothetical protein
MPLTTSIVIGDLNYNACNLISSRLITLNTSYTIAQDTVVMKIVRGSIIYRVRVQVHLVFACIRICNVFANFLLRSRFVFVLMRSLISGRRTS